MVNHIVMWNFKPEVPEAEKETIKKDLSILDKLNIIEAFDNSNLFGT